jgi:malate permease and related proteins
MDLFITTFESVAVLLGIGIVGFWIIKKRIVPGNILGLLSPLALVIALPSLIFINIINNFEPSKSTDWWQLPLWWGFFTIISGCLTFIFMFISQKKTRREFSASLFYQNGIFFPLAVLTGIFGSESQYVVFLFLFIIFYPALFFGTYFLFFKNKDVKSINWKRIIHPVLIFTIIAIIIKLSGTHNYIPYFVSQIFTLLGGMTVPLIMIILGGNIYLDFQKKGKMQLFEISKFVIIKNLVFPLIFIVILISIKSIISYPIAIIILLQAAVPPLTAVPLVTERSGGDRAIVNQFIVASFGLSLITIPAMVFLFESYF